MGRPPLRERIDATLASGRQAEDNDHESSDDRVKALASASPLGIALKRLATKRSAAHMHQAIDTLEAALKQANHYARNHPDGELANLAKVAVLEWLQPNCGRCIGRGWVQDGRSSKDGHSVMCPACGGFGKHRYTKGQRSRAFGRVLTPIQEKRIDDACDLIRDHDALSTRTVRRLLGD